MRLIRRAMWLFAAPRRLVVLVALIVVVPLLVIGDLATTDTIDAALFQQRALRLALAAVLLIGVFLVSSAKAEASRARARMAEVFDRQTALWAVLKTISLSAFDLGVVLHTIAERATALTGAETATVYRRDGDVFIALARWGVLLSADGVIGAPTSIDNQTIVGRAMLTRQREYIADSRQQPRVGRAEKGPETQLAIPFVRDGVSVGALWVGSRAAHPFTERELQVVEAFANQASIAIENVRLLSETREALEQQTAISEILRVISRTPTDLRPVLSTIAKTASRFCATESTSIVLVRDGKLQIAGSHGAVEGERPDWLLSRESISGRAIIDRRSIQVPDLQVEPGEEYAAERNSARQLGQRATLATPLLRDDEAVGALVLGRIEARPFTPRQIELAESFAHQAVIAIENARLFLTVRRQSQELSRFLSPQVAALITSDEGTKLLEGHRRQITVIFCDLRGFTSFSETVEPEEVLGVLRQHQAAMGELIVKYGGTLEHFAGDGMMVFFNDPVLMEGHERVAVRLAVAMRDRFADLASGWKLKGYDLGLGIGVATGYATLGRIGFEGRYDYGAVGNVVILASRLSTEARPGQILVSQRVRAAVAGDVETVPVGELALKGMTRPVPAFDVLATR